MGQGISLAISAYNDNSYDLYLQGLVNAGGIARYLEPDMDRIHQRREDLLPNPLEATSSRGRTTETHKI
jgi:hypothetical protein